MGSLFKQCGAVMMLNLRSIPQRLSMSLASVFAIAMAVGVLIGLFALLDGFRATMQGSGSNSVVVVYRKGATSEISSILTSDQVTLLQTGPGVAQRGNAPFVSPEVNLVVDGTKRSSHTQANMPLRGMGTNGLAIRSGAHLVAGRMFTPGTNEIVVGKGLLKEFAGFELGNSVRLGANTWKIVGIFEAPGTVFESELWADARVVQSLFNRGSSYQVMRVALARSGDFNAFKTFVENDPRLQLAAERERDYYSKQASGTINVIKYIGWPLAIIMGIGALAGALNTMYSSVAARSAEIATLRIIGFSGFAAFWGTLVEAMALSVLGALVATAACFIFFNGMTASTLGSSFTQVVFQLKITPQLITQAIVMAVVIGFIGGLLPGIRAARQSPQIELAAQ